ncbi:hypothetical protein REPUB_Repub12eG0123500 [Reevesia pubescens]
MENVVGSKGTIGLHDCYKKADYGGVGFSSWKKTDVIPRDGTTDADGTCFNDKDLKRAARSGPLRDPSPLLIGDLFVSKHSLEYAVSDSFDLSAPPKKLPWLITGDFNELLLQEENIEDALKLHWQMLDFRKVVSECGFEDLPIVGPSLTWHKKVGSEMIYEKLDRCIATSSWCFLFPFSVEEHLISHTSDHLPILFKVNAVVLDHQG